MVEPESNTITSEELATRVRRVVGRRFRRDTAAVHAPKTAKQAVKTPAWLALGYDFLVISLAVFFVAVLALNMSIAGSWRERGNQWSDRARWQQELHTWEHQLARQEQQLEQQCQRLAATLIARRAPDEQQHTLDQIRVFRHQLRAANQSLSLAVRQGNLAALNQPNEAPNDPTTPQLSVTALKAKREQLIELQYAARSQFNSEHPTLQAIEHQLEELDRQVATAERSPDANGNYDSGTRVQVIENQFLRNASSSQLEPKATAPASREFLQQVQGIEQRFTELRESAETCLRNIDQRFQSLEQSDEQRATAWDQVAGSLRAMARECAMPEALQKTVDQQNELRSEPTITSFSLLLCLLIAIGTSGGVIWHAQIPALTTEPTTTEKPETLTVNTVTKQLGCAPGAVLPWEMLPAEEKQTQPEPVVSAGGKTLQQKLRFASECLLATAIAVTLVVALTHGQFGGWLATNPLTAWGRLWGS